MGSLRQTDCIVVDRTPISLVADRGRSTGYLHVEQFVRKVEDSSKGTLLADEKTEMKVFLLESFEFLEGTGDSELFLEFSAAIFECLVMQEDDVGVAEVLTSLLAYFDVHLPNQRYIQ